MTSFVQTFGEPENRDLRSLLPTEALALADADHQQAMPAIARDKELSSVMEEAAKSVPTRHEVILGDSREMSALDDESVHLVLTSPPYWNIKSYESGDGQLGLVDDYEQFLE